MLASMSVPIATTAMSKSRDADLRQGVAVGRVGLRRLRQQVGVILDGLRVGVDAEHLVPELDQRLSPRAAEPAEPDDEELLLPSQ